MIVLIRIRGRYYPKGNEQGVLVGPVLWEVRRERIVELMGEGFGFYDIRPLENGALVP